VQLHALSTHRGRVVWSCFLCGLGLSLLGNLGFGTDAPSEANTAWVKIDEADLKRHTGFLASDTLEGRQAGSRGGQAAAAYLVTELKRIGLQPAGPDQQYRQSFGANYTNVLAQLSGDDPAQAGDVVLLGAHYDHVGYGNPQNSFGPYGRIHNGADDNASGVSVLLEIAECLAQAPSRPRTVLFAFWDAEEIGLLGSQYWVAHPTVDRLRLRLAINLDMIGRLRNNEVTVMGWRTAAGLRNRIVDQNSETQLQFKFDWAVTSDSDHHAFYTARIPVLHFDTGKHDDYHRPSDDVERLNWNGMQRLGSLVAQLVDDAARTTPLPTFRLESWNERQQTWPLPNKQAPPTRFGLSWRPEAAQQGIVEVLRVAVDSPAASVGLQPGDRLVQFGDWKNGSLLDLRTTITTSAADIPIAWTTATTNAARQGMVRLRGEPLLVGLTYRQDATLPECGVVETVIETSPADRAGLLPGDVLRKLNDFPVPPPAAFSARLQTMPREIVIHAERRGLPFTALLRTPRAMTVPAD